MQINETQTIAPDDITHSLYDPAKCNFNAHFQFKKIFNVEKLFCSDFQKI